MATNTGKDYQKGAAKGATKEKRTIQHNPSIPESSMDAARNAVSAYMTARTTTSASKIKRLLRTPVLKDVDLDELKARFNQAVPPKTKEEKPKADAGAENPPRQVKKSQQAT